MGKVGRPPGQPKTGGRKKGTTNSVSKLVVIKELEKHNFDLIAEVIKFYNDRETPPELRYKTLELLVAYTAAKPAPPKAEAQSSLVITRAEIIEAEELLEGDVINE